MTGESPTGRDKLYSLMQRFRGGSISADGFCFGFEEVYSFEVEHGALSEMEREAFTALFKNVACYSPGKDIEGAVSEAYRVLGLS